MSELLLTGGLVLSADGERFERAGDVLVRDGRIAAIGQGLRADETLAMTDRFIVPGLIDSHYHLVSRSDVQMDVGEVSTSMIEGVVNAADCIASGVTSVRDCGCRHEGIYSLRSAIADGTIVGPTPYAAGRNPTGRLAPAHWRNVVVDGTESARRAVREQHVAGADWVKLILAHTENPFDWSDVVVYLTEAEIAAAVDEAHSLGIAIGGHCEGWHVAEQAVALGLDSLDHAPLVSEPTARAMAERGTVYVPTVWAFSDDSGVETSDLSATQLEALAEWQAEHRNSVRRARDAGVVIAAGSDAADALTGRGVLANELLALRDCGLTAAEVLRAATSAGAALQRRGHEIGSITVGYLADLAVFDRDPLADTAALADPAFVLSNGDLAYDRARGVLPPVARQSTPLAVTRRWA